MTVIVAVKYIIRKVPYISRKFFLRIGTDLLSADDEIRDIGVETNIYVLLQSNMKCPELALKASVVKYSIQWVL